MRLEGAEEEGEVEDGGEEGEEEGEEGNGGLYALILRSGRRETA
jgi:hypothetical protein